MERRTISLKEISAVLAISVLLIGVFIAMFYGVNRLAFAQATSGTETMQAIENPAPGMQAPAANGNALSDLPPPQYTHGDNVNQVFQPPTLTLSIPPWQQYHEIPPLAIPMDEAAQIGAEYIWDVFGVSIDGMHIEMFASTSENLTRTYWHGSVYLTEEDAMENLGSYSVPVRVMTSNEEARIPAISDQPRAVDVPDRTREETRQNIESWERELRESIENYHEERTNTVVSETPLEEIRFHIPVYTFMIDAVTGMRIDINYNARDTQIDRNYLTTEVMLGWREAVVASGWFEMDITGQVAYAGLSESQIETYTQTAKEYAQRHFNNSTVVSISLEQFGINPSPAGIEIINLSFVAIDDTGREAHVNVPTASASIRSVWISTQHNDFIPGVNIVGGRG